ncbi:signal peptidase II [Candidatus Woesearchaeota archaeon]|nr:signal peptidase II [Candidatus Woesearchaeota archaeon]
MKTRISHGKKNLFLILVIVLFDQITKYFARVFEWNYYFLSFTTNTGAAFSLLRGNNVFLLVFGLLLLSVFVWLFLTSEKKYQLPLALIIAGAIGNLIDRLFFGYVIDFINLRVWPVFNIADSAITIGAIMLILIAFKKK